MDRKKSVRITNRRDIRLLAGPAAVSKKAAEIFIIIACVIVLAAVTTVFAMGAGYTVLSGDDFTHDIRLLAGPAAVSQDTSASLPPIPAAVQK